MEEEQVPQKPAAIAIGQLGIAPYRTKAQGWDSRASWSEKISNQLITTTMTQIK
jgi:hypothetical protein